MKNKILSKKNFLELNNKISKNLFTKKDYLSLYKVFLKKTLTKRIAHQTLWFGEPILQLPQDLMIFQELIFKSKPDYIIEVGIAWSGSLIYYSSILNILGGKKVIGIDNFVPKEIEKRIQKFSKLKNRIKIIKGISTDPKVLIKLKSIIKNSKKMIVHLDSDHSEQNVLKELNIYSKLLKKGSFLICGDTHIELFKNDLHGKNKKYSKGDNPMTALKIFLKSSEGKKFKQDTSFQDRYLLTLNPFGILKKIRN
jgi:cephalosporin hydroxylase|tara:strand:- start:36 stop:794 length:759 start_codon:yes stop_codon:yes gene_type:complete